MGCQQRTSSSSCVGIMDRALELDRAGADVIHLEKGEPDLDTPEVVKARAVQAIHDNDTRYAASAGLPELREAVCDHYLRLCGVRIDPTRVFVTSGSSPALLTLALAALSAGDEVVLSDPCYPAYPRLAEVAGARPVYVSTEATGFALTAQAVRRALTAATRAIVVNSPSNPAGGVIDEDELRALAELGPLVVSDDAYLGLQFDPVRPPCVLRFTEEAVLVGTFSKAFNMTGWRLGYLVVPERLVARVAQLQESFFISANTFVQRAGVTALAHAESLLAATRDELRARCSGLLAGLAGLGFQVPSVPRGGPFVFARLPEQLVPAAGFARDLLEEAHVAITPGGEFGPGSGAYVRLSCSAPPARIEEAIGRIAAFVRGRAAPEPGELEVVR